MRIAFRPAEPQDFGYCAQLYFAGMEHTIRELKLDMDAHTADFRRRWEVTQVRIITRDGADVGWLQTRTEGDAFFLAQLFVEGSFHGQGIGTEVMRLIIAEAAGANQAVTLGVVKTNPAMRLYQRLGFQTTHEDDSKFYMRRQPDTSREQVGPPEQAMEPREFVAYHRPALERDASVCELRNRDTSKEPE